MVGMKEQISAEEFTMLERRCVAIFRKDQRKTGFTNI